MPVRTPTFEEIAHWSIDDINVQILGLVPAGWKFELETHPTHWRASYKTENGTEAWAEEHWELRILLLSAFAWLWQRRNPTRVHPAWQPRQPPPLVAIRPGSGTVPGPQDLEPEHIRSVYDAHARKRGKETG